MSAHVSQSAQNFQSLKLQPEGIYGEDESDEEDVHRNRVEDAEIKPSKRKFDKFVEEVKNREILADQRLFPDIKVDP